MLSLLFLLACGSPDAPKAKAGTDTGTDTGLKTEPCTPTTWYLDADGDGYGDPFVEESACDAPQDTVSNHDDCNDQDAGEYPGAVWYRDVDGDGFGDPESSMVSCSQPIGHITDASDCDDLDSTRYPGEFWYTDEDADGYGDESQTVDACSDVSTAVSTPGDCDDSDWLIHPTANEVCDEIDNDCDGDIDDDDPDIDIFTQVHVFEDLDGDGYGTDISLGLQCLSNITGSTQVGDCDDTDALIYPYRLDYHDDIDSDCDGESELFIVSSTTKGWINDATGSAFGVVVASKDIDGDGLREVVVGPYNVNDHAGGVRLIPGDLTGDRTYFPDEGFLWDGELASDKAGYAVQFAGDWNGDGVEDLAVGAPYRTEDVGIAYIISSDMPSGSLSDAMHIMTMDTADSYFGHSVLGVGDLDSDGMDEVLVSARKDHLMGSARGSITIFYGGDTEATTPSGDTAIFGDTNWDQFGYAMANVGDPDGDGVDDILVSSPYCDDGANAGGCVFLLSKNHLSEGVDTLEEVPSFWATQEHENAGIAVASAGDFDGDGVDDLLIGSHNLDVTTLDEGGAYLVLGSTTGWSPSLDDSHLKMLGAVEQDKTGRHLDGVGDVNGDDKSDFVVGAFNSDVHLENAGMIYGILGGHEGGTLTLADAADFKIVGEGTNDYVGRGIAQAGDVNDDGMADFWLGAHGAGSYGSIYLIEGAGLP